MVFHLRAEVGEIGAHVDFARAARGAAAGGAVGAAAAADAAAIGLAAATVLCFFLSGAEWQSQGLEEDEHVVAAVVGEICAEILGVAPGGEGARRRPMPLDPVLAAK